MDSVELGCALVVAFYVGGVGWVGAVLFQGGGEAGAGGGEEAVEGTVADTEEDEEEGR